jgi:hypothetical protein
MEAVYMGAMQLEAVYVEIVYIWRLKPEDVLPGVSVYRSYVPGDCLRGGLYPEAVCLKSVFLEAVNLDGAYTEAMHLEVMLMEAAYFEAVRVRLSTWRLCT